MECEINSDAAESPARPEPITIALLDEGGLVGDMMEEARWRQSMEAMAMKKEIESSVRMRFRDIEIL